jgi:cytidyltransferase-like protein
MSEFYLRLNIKPKTDTKRKIMKLTEIKKISEKVSAKKKTVGLITGCFDVLHLGHIELFRFAKKQVDVLVVGIENDRSIKLTKGEARPIFNQRQRAQQLSELKSVDYVFIINGTENFDSQKTEMTHERIIKQVKPTHLFTTPAADKYWRAKKARASMIGAKLVNMPKRRQSSTSQIITLLSQEL